MTQKDNRTMNTQDAKQQLTRKFIDHARQDYPEADENLNDASRAAIEACYQEHGQAFLWIINQWTNVPRPVVSLYNPNSPIFNFSYHAVSSEADPELEHLIEQRNDAPYTGTRDDAQRVKAIIKRLEAIGGTMLHWS